MVNKIDDAEWERLHAPYVDEGVVKVPVKENAPVEKPEVVEVDVDQTSE